MKKIILVSFVILLAVNVFADVKSWNDIAIKVATEPKVDLAALLKQIELKPAKDPKTGEDVMQVTRIDQGSAYQKFLKVGDLVKIDKSKPLMPDYKKPTLIGSYAFDWYSVKSSKCVKIDKALAKTMAALTCGASTATFGGDEKPPTQSCKNKKETSEYLVYETAKDCNAARDSELANGD